MADINELASFFNTLSVESKRKYAIRGVNNTEEIDVDQLFADMNAYKQLIKQQKDTEALEREVGAMYDEQARVKAQQSRVQEQQEIVKKAQRCSIDQYGNIVNYVNSGSVNRMLNAILVVYINNEGKFNFESRYMPIAPVRDDIVKNRFNEPVESGKVIDVTGGFVADQISAARQSEQRFCYMVIFAEQSQGRVINSHLTMVIESVDSIHHYNSDIKSKHQTASLDEMIRIFYQHFVNPRSNASKQYFSSIATCKINAQLGTKTCTAFVMYAYQVLLRMQGLDTASVISRSQPDLSIIQQFYDKIEEHNLCSMIDTIVL